MDQHDQQQQQHQQHQHQHQHQHQQHQQQQQQEQRRQCGDAAMRRCDNAAGLQRQCIKSSVATLQVISGNAAGLQRQLCKSSAAMQQAFSGNAATLQHHSMFGRLSLPSLSLHVAIVAQTGMMHRACMLVFYTAVHQRQRFYYRNVGEDEVRRARLQLPPDDRRLASLLAQSGNQPARGDGQAPASVSAAAVHGVLLLSPGPQWIGPLTDWHWQARCLRRYFLNPIDSLALRVDAAAKLPMPMPCSSRRCTKDILRRSAGGRPGRESQGHHGAFVPLLLDSFASWLLEDGRSIAQFAQEHRCELEAEWTPCILVVDVIADLIHQGTWTWLVGLGRWHALMQKLPIEIAYKGPFHERGVASIDELSITPARLESLAQHLRMRVPSILNGPNGEDEHWALSQAVLSLDTWAAGLAGRFRMESALGNRFHYSTALLVDVLRLCRHVRGANLEFVLRQAVNIVFPGVLQASVQDLFEPKHGQRFVVPSKTARHRYRLSLDVSLMLLHRRQASTSRRIRFGWADSSPQHTRDWLLCSHDSLDETDLLQASVAVDALLHYRFEREAGDDDDGSRSDDDALVAAEAVAAHQSFLFQALRRHDHPPSAMGKGTVQLADKVGALLQAWALECEDSESLSAFLNSFHSFTSDLGVEIGIADFRCVDTGSLLPVWMRRLDLSVDVDIDGDAAPAAAHEPSWHFLPNSVAVPGLLHIIFNLAKELATHYRAGMHFGINSRQLNFCSALEPDARLS